jgi:glycosyltransferase involved in cell wall biosynthesis
MLTYNHAPFIAQAIEGVMMQVTDFPVQLIIGEDCSTDHTREICVAYKTRFPDRITLRLPGKNLGGMTNFLQNLDVCMDGYKYVAMCEGDDYWIDPDKLQKQIDYLEAHADTGLVYTHFKNYNETRGQFIDMKPRFVTDDSHVIPELIKTKYIEFPTIVVRADLLRKIVGILEPEWQGKIVGDTRLILEFAQHAKIGYLPEVTTVYRTVSGSASQPKTVDKFLFVSNDTYECRRNFVLRYGYSPKLLAVPLCNFNRGLVHKAAAQHNYPNALRLLANLKISELFKYSDFKTIRQKTDAKIVLKFIISLLGIGALKNSLRRI